MSAKLIMSLALTLLAASAQACDSPMMNHDQAPPAGASRSDNSGTRAQSDCPLAFPKHRVCAALEWDNPPVDGQNSPFKLRFWSMGQGTLNGPYSNPPHPVAVKLWMPAMGHGSSPVTVKQASEAGGSTFPGVFQADNVYFIMPGTWEIRVQLVHDANTHEDAVLSVDIQ